MTLRSIPLILCALSAVHMVVGGTRPRLGLAGAHVSRQINIPSPPQCDSSCDPINTIAQQSCPITECCTPLFQSGYFDCLKCVGIADNATTADFALAQTDLDDFTIACSKEGFALPELTLPGQNPNRTLATASGVPSSTKSISQITVSSLPSGILNSSSLPATSTISQKTVTSVPTQSSASSPPGPTTSTTPNSAVHHFGGLSMAMGFLGVAVTACMMF
ncbi:hypothetical protein C8F04DRAFT_1060307 [Mycena alexandri]|uniref:Uncharacterized protein n=1 Tax=Mycena alexandri TaxID=1745969 RepID=A0AAD6TM17_9AGAR|nr:hypothetical protein C8F04DRAFT_1060307 [Mycena alexandri]